MEASAMEQDSKISCCTYSAVQNGSKADIFFGKTEDSDGYLLCSIEEHDPGTVNMIVGTLNAFGDMSSRISQLEIQNLLLTAQVNSLKK